MIVFASYFLSQSYTVYQLYLMYPKFETWAGLRIRDKLFVMWGVVSTVFMVVYMVYGLVVYPRTTKESVKATE
jgi:type II secretory pathway component PulM